MKKIYELVILIGFAVFFIGGILCVGGQMAGLIIGRPELVLLADQLTKIIFPAASASGLLCFLHGYLFKKDGKGLPEVES